MLGWLLHAQVGLLGDGIMRAADAVRIKAPMPSELLPSATSMALARYLPPGWGVDGYLALRLISVTSGVGLVLGLWWLAPKAGIERPSLLVFWLLTFGSSRLFAGYLETYAPAVAAAMLWTLASLAYIRGHGKATTVVVFWLLACLSHAMAFALTPATLFVIGFGRAERGVNWHLLLVFTGIVVAVGLYIGTGIHALQVEGEGAEVGYFLLPLLPQPPHHYGVISGAHFLDLMNQWLLLAPALIVAAIMLLSLTVGDKQKRSGLHRRTWAALSCTEGRFWLLAAALPIAGGFLLDPKLGWARDWDLFTIFFAPALVGGAVWLAGLTSFPVRRVAASVAVLSLSLWMVFSVDAEAERVRFEALLEVDPSRADYGHEILALYYRDAGRPLGAIAHYRKALEITDNVRYQSNIAGMLMDLDRLTEAEEWYQSVLDRDSTYDPAVYGMALILRRTGRLKEALSYAEQALVPHPQDPDRRFTLGSIQMSLGNPEAAFPHLQFTARARPREPLKVSMLGACYFELGRYHEARAALQQALRIDSTYTMAYLIFAGVELATQRYDECRRWLNAYERLVPPEERNAVAGGLADSLRRIVGEG